MPLVAPVIKIFLSVISKHYLLLEAKNFEDEIIMETHIINSILIVFSILFTTNFANEKLFCINKKLSKFF